MGYPGSNLAQHLRFDWTTEGMKSFTSEANVTLNNNQCLSYGVDGTAYITHVQLEEGTKVTEWEPYYITNNLNIVQNKDHTLKAIWKEI